MENLDINSIGYGILVGLLGFLGISYLVQAKRSQHFENEANKEETLVKVDEKKEEDDAEPIDKAIGEFDSELDSDNPNKPKSS